LDCSGIGVIFEWLQISLTSRLYGLDPAGSLYGKQLDNKVVLGYKDEEFQYWVIEDHQYLPQGWEITGRVEQKLLEIGMKNGSK